MTMQIPAFFKTTKGMIIAGVAGFLLVTGLVVLVLTLTLGARNDSNQGNNSSSSNSNTGGSGSGGQGITSDVRRILKSVSSTRNLSGLTLRINQIDICQLPDLTAYVAVATDSGDISQLNANDVKVYLDGKLIENPQFSKVDANKQPLSATIVFDRSGSMRGAPIEQARSAAQQFVDKAAANDKLALVQFDHEVNTLSGLTTDRASIKNAIGGIAVRGDTALYDALSQGVSETSGCSRRAVVLLSDGGDTASKNASLDNAINQANVAGIPVFVVGLQGETYDANTLKAIADRTGGQLFETADPAALADLYNRVDAQLKGQYYIGLKLNIPKDGKEHRLKIESNIQGSPTSSERSFVY